MARNSGHNVVPIRHGHGRYPIGTPDGFSRALGARNKLIDLFLRDLQADWEQHDKDISEVMRKKHPDIYFQRMVKLALVQGASLTSLGRTSGSTHLKT
jgi:hypothetical protein